MTTVTVNASRRYDVLVGNGLLSSAGEIISKVTKAKKFALVTDDNVASLYADTVISSLEAKGFSVCKFIFPHGEKSKCSQVLNELYDFLTDMEITRSDSLIALGGGVVGDLTGFASATYLRGLDFIQIPTSLLAQVDSSVGGKTAIDIAGGKNLVGAFKQPNVVICDLDTLNTLPHDFFIDGMGEAIKYGMIKDSELFDLFLNGDWNSQKEEVVSRCIGIKRDVVEADEFDKGERMLLNFGHTLGHAIEKYYHYEGISHGKAVAIGMAIITRFAAKNGICDVSVYEKLCRCLKRWELEADIDIPLDELTKLCLNDKKRENQILHLVLCNEIGNSFTKPLTISEFFEFFK